MEAEIGVAHLRAKEHGGLLAVPEAKEPHSPLEPSETAWPGHHFDFRFLATRTVRIKFCGRRPPDPWSFVLEAPGN